MVNGGKAEVKETLTHKAETKVTAIRVSNGEDKFLVSGDNLKNVILFNAQDYTVRMNYRVNIQREGLSGVSRALAPWLILINSNLF